MNEYIVISLFLFLILFVISCEANRIKLTDVQTLTLYSGRYTSSRRGKSIQQLSCEGNYCNQAFINAVQCYNRGNNAGKVQWECKAEMPSNLKFDKLDVSCEGYDGSSDNYILEDSCALRYSLRKLDHYDSFGKNKPYDYPSASKSHDSTSFSWLPIVVVILIIVFIYYKCLKGSNKNQRSINNNPDEGPTYPSQYPPTAPPPPGFRTDFFDEHQSQRDPPYNPNFNQGFYSDRFGFQQQQSRQSSNQRSNGSSMWPGTLGGMAAGGLMGYLFGSRSRDNQTSFFRSPRTSSWMPSNDVDDYSANDIFSTESSTRFRSNNSDSVEESTGFSSTTIR
ncbi:Store-operated calcium entry-associated regulatory factor [Sarcoptes scabiei]|uniref:Store-operated calcium entry-associated regulatory factor n=1 Tax=Sarcoptes scabiei TaxID=52283 RepID=A0A132ACZ3_SARSC|nr:Store-operated calcium entry-associated regulatory factor [Sarcoptes scabiei]KPM08787.1 DUF1183 domain containing protein [Sarcoptes scabiei]UXI14801.1 low-density lipoprotein receptor-related protein 2-like [Sarcoptes scabiei]